MTELAEPQAYCLKCKAKIEIADPQPAVSKNGSSGI
ncbi:MAG: DUF5679 domain-containing protein, partial [Anaerolineae bacterium]